MESNNVDHTAGVALSFLDFVRIKVYVHRIMSSHLDFEWDPQKNRRNLKDHKISFEIAKLAFDDPNHLTKFDRCKDGEERWHTLGYIGPVLIIVVHTYRMTSNKEIVRLISARKATAHEKNLYRTGTR